MSKSIIIVLILGLLAGLTTGCKKKEANLPNVVVIVIDTLRSDHLPFYGYEKNTAPFLNQLAKDSVLFEKTWSASSWTAPATASLFTSMYPFQHGIVLNMLATVNFNKKKNGVKIKLNRIPDKISTLGEVMKEQGYATYLVSDNLNIGEKENFTQGFDKYATYCYQSAETVNNQVKEWAEEMKKQERYFLYIQYMDPHMPNHERAPWFKDTGDEKGNALSRYDSEINYVDRKIKELFKLFQWDKNTLVVFTADHGEEFWDHGKKGHGHALYRELIQVPLFFYYPDGKFKAGRIPFNVSLLDVLPTLRDFIRLQPDKDHQGMSLLPVLKGKTDIVGQRFLFSHIMRRTAKLESMESFSVISGRWHLIKDFLGKNTLFNLNNDLTEQVNRIDVQQQLLEKLLARYFNFKKKCKKYKQDVIDHKMSKEQSDRLKTLGYVQ